MSPVETCDVAVVGGGITGVVAAHHLRRCGLRVILLESADRLGGKVRTARVAGEPVECGPDGFRARGSTLPALCAELGLADQLVSPALDRAGIWSDGRLLALPRGLAMGVPSRPVALVRSGLLTVRGAARAAFDLVLPRGALAETTVAEALEARFGREVRERLIDPLVGGVYAGDTTRLGFSDALPELYAAAVKDRSLLLAIRRRPRSTGQVFQTLREGLRQLPERAARGVEVRLNTPVTGVRELAHGFELSTHAGTVTARAVIVATPAFVAARLLEPIDPPAAELLAATPYAGVATLALAYPRGRLPASRTTGFLVPPRETSLVTAVTWLWEKWPCNDGRVALVRCSVGRYGDDRWRGMDDQRLIESVRADLARLAGVTSEPLDAHLTRWETALPQYSPGHAERLAQIEARVARHPGLLVAGAAYHGIGLSACAIQGERAAATAAVHCAEERAA